MDLVFRYYLHFLVFIILTYCVGKGIRKILKLQAYFFTDTFYSLLLGSIVCSTLQAVWFTKGQTVHTIFIFLGLYFWYFRHKQPKVVVVESYNLPPKLLLFLTALFVATIGIYAWEAVFLFKSGEFPYIVPFKDIAYYSLVSDYLSITGYENRLKYATLIDADYQYLQLYHYFTLWNTNFVTQYFGGLSIHNYTLVVVNHLVFTCFVGIVGFWEHIKLGQIKWWYIAFAALFLFINTFAFKEYQSIHFLRNVHEFDFPLFDFMGKKVGYYYVFFVGFFLLAANKRYVDAVLIGVCLPISTIAILPSMIGGLLIAVFIWGVWQKQHWKTILLTTLPIITTLVGIFLMNKIFGNPEVSTSKLPLQNLINGLSDVQKYRTYFNIIVGTNIHFVIIYFPYLAIISYWTWKYREFIAKQEAYKFILLVIIAVFEVTLVIWALLMQEQNSFQLVMFNLLPLMNCAFTFFLIHGLAQFRVPKLTYVVIILLLALNFYRILVIQLNNKGNDSNINSDSYLKSIENLVKTKQITATGGYLMRTDEYVTDYLKLPHYENVGGYLGLMMPAQACYSLSDMEIPEAMDLLVKDKIETTKESGIALGTFFRFVKKQHKNKTFVSISKSKIEFMQKYKFSYLIVSKDIDMTPFKDLITKELVDTKSGERFFVLKKM